METNFWELLISNWEVKLLVFARILTAFSVIPLISRANIPTRLRIGASILVAYIITLSMNMTDVDTGINMGTYVLAILREMFVGVVIGFIMNIYVLTVQVSGDIMDAQSGLSMAKVFDPGSNIQMSIFGTFISYIMFMYFFITNCHLSILNLFITSYETIPAGLGHGLINPQLGWTIASFFSQMLVIALKLAMPVLTVEMVLHFSVGILMKVVPQIQIMVINMQLQMVIGFIMLFAIAGPMAEFIETYVYDMMESAQNIIPEIFAG